MNPTIAKVAHIVPWTKAEGPGERFAIWFQGCLFRCPECCNPEMLSFDGGKSQPVTDVVEQLRKSQNQHPNLEGITLLGGEPFAHAKPAAHIAKAARAMGLSVMIFSGYEYAALRDNEDADVQSLLSKTDLLVDGLYDKSQPDTTRRWIGSANQKIWYLTNRYSADDAYWSEPDTLEIRLENQNLTINGFPAKSAVGLWKRGAAPKNERRKTP